jgi:hypothetical protein
MVKYAQNCILLLFSKNTLKKAELKLTLLVTNLFIHVVMRKISVFVNTLQKTDTDQEVHISHSRMVKR